MFSFNNEIEDLNLENEFKLNEKNTNDHDQEEENEYNYEEVLIKNNKSSSNKSTKEEENYIYVAENGDLHYVDQEGSIFKCREDDGDYILEEQIFSAKENLIKEKKNKQTKEVDDDDLKDEYFLDEQNEDSLENDDEKANVSKKEILFEEFVFMRNEEDAKVRNITKGDLTLERIHKLRDKVKNSNKTVSDEFFIY